MSRKLERLFPTELGLPCDCGSPDLATLFGPAAARTHPAVGELSAVPALGLRARLRATLEMIRFSHSVFALPFALLSLFVASGGMPSVSVLLWVLVAMVAARSAAMAFNRIADRSL